MMLRAYSYIETRYNIKKCSLCETLSLMNVCTFYSMNCYFLMSGSAGSADCIMMYSELSSLILFSLVWVT